MDEGDRHFQRREPRSSRPCARSPVDWSDLGVPYAVAGGMALFKLMASAV